MAATVLTYNSYDLNNTTATGVFTTLIEDGNAFDRDLTMHKLLRSGGAVITDATYYTKVIRISGTITATTVAGLETLIDTFQAALNYQDKNLDVEYAGSTRRYVCTPQRVQIDRPVRAALFAEFEVDFVATEYGKDTTTTTLLSASANTTTPRTIALTVGGSAPEQFLRIQITVTAATGLTSKVIGVENDTTGARLYVTRTWTVGDVLEIVTDRAAPTVKVNGTLVDFSGAFPIFAPGSHNMIIDNTFTTRTLTTTIDYTKRYI